jgi:poly-beta-1,6-N-acetyl-D-glucosamine synthase
VVGEPVHASSVFDHREAWEEATVTAIAGKVFWLCAAGVGYVYAGYPAALWALTRKRSPDTITTTAARPPVSMIIAAYNEEAAIAAKIENSLALDYPDLELIVVSDGSNDATAAIASGYADRGVVALHDPARNGKSAALNRGAAAARGEILVFSDANNDFDRTAIEALVGAFADPRVGGATGQKTVLTDSAVGESEGLYWRYEAAIREMESTLGSCTAANGEILAVRADAFQPIPADIINDDLYLAMTILSSGRRFVYVPGAISREKPSDSMSSERERRSRMSAGRFALIARPGFATGGGPLLSWQFFSHKVGRLAVPFLLLAAAVASLLAAFGGGTRRGIVDLAPPWAGIAVAGQVAVYGAAAVGIADPPALGSSPVAKVCRALGYLVAGNLSVLSGWWRFVRGQQTVQWERVGRSQ